MGAAAHVNVAPDAEHSTHERNESDAGSARRRFVTAVFCLVTLVDGGVRHRVVRAAMVDDHPAMRAGIRAVLDAAPGIAFVGEASEGRELWPMLERTAPDVILMDYHLPDEDGLVLCHRVKRRVPAPRVAILSAYANEAMVAAAMLAQADAVLSKQAPARVLCETVRNVVADPVELELSPRQRMELADVLEPEEVALAGLLSLRTPTRELARSVGVEPAELCRRVEALLYRVCAAYGLPHHGPRSGGEV
jgi:DNA-binding NarL/FixJ family response regulator